jgi:hypothetical protein
MNFNANDREFASLPQMNRKWRAQKIHTPLSTPTFYLLPSNLLPRRQALPAFYFPSGTERAHSGLPRLPSFTFPNIPALSIMVFIVIFINCIKLIPNEPESPYPSPPSHSLESRALAGGFAWDGGAGAAGFGFADHQ